jgi:hypothetical protein
LERRKALKQPKFLTISSYSENPCKAYILTTSLSLLILKILAKSIKNLTVVKVKNISLSPALAFWLVQHIA